MRPILTSYLGVRTGGLPLLKSPIENGKIIFNIDKVTSNDVIKASGEIDIVSNKMIIDPFSRMDKSELDPSRQHLFNYAEEYFARQAFEEQAPHIEIYCPNKKCKLQYSLHGDIMKSDRDHQLDAWHVRPFLLFQETFVVDGLFVQNDWIHNQTNIYASNANFNAEPIKNALIDFKSMSKNKLFNRIKTLVTFS